MLKKTIITHTLAFAAFVLAMSFLAYHRLNPLLFNPVNGDFQTFNPISRLLAGQFPYHDFANYLGVGPLALTAIAAVPAGLSVATSVAATEILVSLAFLYMATTAFRLLGTPRPWIFAIVMYLVGKLGVFMEFLPATQPILGVRFLIRELTTYLGLTNLVSPGHSLMPLRVLWPFFAALPLFVYLKRPSLQRAAILGAALGAGLLWSNDYGPTTAVAFGLVAGFASRNLRHIILALGVSLVVAGIVVFAVTGGHPMDWVNFNHAVAQDQFWYYYYPEKKIVSIDAIELDEATWVLLLVLFTGIGVLQDALRNHTPDILVFLAIFVTSVFAGVLSMVGSSWFSYYLTAPLFLSVVYLCHQAVPWLRARVNPDGRATRTIFAFLVTGLAAGFILHPAAPAVSADEMRLGAKLHKNYDEFGALMKLARADNPVIWSTYTTAVEAALGTHQPTGQDYIIHALGDDGRQKYLDGFRRTAPQMVITPRPDKILWEVWSRIVNWWFYRELLRDYEPVAHYAYWTVWQQHAQHHAPSLLDCAIHQDAPGSVRIVVTGGPERAGHVADLRLVYSAESPPFTRLSLEVVDEGLRRQHQKAIEQAGLDPKTHLVQSSVGFPPNAGAWHVPIHLNENGTGTSTVHANLRSPRGARLTVHECEARAWAPAGRIDQ